MEERARRIEATFKGAKLILEGPTPDEKTIGPRAEKEYRLLAPVVSEDAKKRMVTQENLAAYDLAIRDVKIAEEEADEIRTMIVGQLRSGWIVEPGVFTASAKPNFKRNAVSWKQEYIDAMGEAEAKKLEEATKGADREISSYSLELRRTDGGAA